MYIIYQIDENGFLIWESGVLVNEGEQLGGYINKPLPEGVSFYKPKWTGTEWIEGKTKDEFLEDEFAAALQPSKEEVEKAKRQLETIELLIELGVI